MGAPYYSQRAVFASPLSAFFIIVVVVVVVISHKTVSVIWLFLASNKKFSTVSLTHYRVYCSIFGTVLLPAVWKPELCCLQLSCTYATDTVVLFRCTYGNAPC